MEFNNQITPQNNLAKFIEFMQKATEIADIIPKVKAKTERAYKAIHSLDKSVKYSTLQAYLKEYGSFINQTTWLTGLCVCPRSADYYDNVPVENLNLQLNTIINFVYLHELAQKITSSAFEKLLKKLQENGY